VAGHQPHPFIRLTEDPGVPESYRLRITPAGLTLSAPDAAGFFYALQTLRQIRQQAGGTLPCLRLTEPRLPSAGVLSGYQPRPRSAPRHAQTPRPPSGLAQINHLSSISNPLPVPLRSGHCRRRRRLRRRRSEDSGAFCRDHFIELVPSFTCFGHLGRFCRCRPTASWPKSNSPAPSWESATWLQRLRGCTLHTRDPDAQDLIRRILDEFLPCFASHRFNLCGDETYDLGRRTPDASPADLARQYTDHLRFLHREASRHGKSLMLWGDMLLKHPEAISRLPDGCEVLDWAYFPSNRFEKCGEFISHGLPTVVCPSVRGFGRLFNAVEEARAVLAAYARTGGQLGARGLLNTDWGDFGHFNMPPGALHGLALGAQLGWNPRNDSGPEFDRAFSALLFGAPDSRPAQLFSLAGSVPDSLACWPFAPLKNTPPPPTSPLRSNWRNKPRPGRMSFPGCPPPNGWTKPTTPRQALAFRFLQFSALVASGPRPGARAPC
jgi:hypothetical protein